MFIPVSKLEYLMLDHNSQAIVVACPMQVKTPEIRRRWASKACASLGDSGRFLPDLVRDLLANPHVRIVVFHGVACGREVYDAFWSAKDDPGWGIAMDHLTLVRTYVDLYDDDFVNKGPMQPFWPTRIRYGEENTTKPR